MWKKLSILLVGVFFASIFSASIVSAAEKLAYVDLTTLFDEYEKTKVYDAEFEKETKAFESAREKKVEEIKKIQESLSMLSEKEKAAKEKQIEEKVADLSQFDRDNGQDLRKKRDEKMKDILEDIEDAIADYAKKQKYTMVFNDRVLVYQEKSLDITKGVLKVLQKKYKR